MPRNQGFSEPEYSAEYSAEYSVSLPSDPDRGVGRTHEISVRNSGSCLCLPRFMRLTFVPESLENLYQTYFKRQRHETLLVLVVFAALFDCYVVVMCAVVFSSDMLAPLAVAAVGLVLDILLFVLCKKGLLPDRVTRKVVPYLLWLLISAQIFSYLGLNFARAHAASDTVGWQAFFVFSFFITLPLSLSPIVLISVVSCVIHTLVLGVTVAQQQQDQLKGMQLLREQEGSCETQYSQQAAEVAGADSGIPAESEVVLLALVHAVGSGPSQLHPGTSLLCVRAYVGLWEQRLPPELLCRGGG
ncbi:Adenylate cyclase type 3 [Tupaia chinensis]|uniref:Adenylate cyclase type 3 n=1 Tax=Tupaia chinensis TaxID=246437 RepID=L9KW73_TUPCH|nr:Adenylate cyclase type 3 [Tupaia chinensis]